MVHLSREVRNSVQESPETLQHWTSERRAALVLGILRDETSTEKAAEEHGLSAATIETWIAAFLEAGSDAMRDQVSSAAPPSAGTSTPPHPAGIGVWTCDFEGETLSPCLFMQALCRDQPVHTETIGWRGGHRPPKPVSRLGTVSLLHGICCIDPPAGDRLHFFSPMMAPGFPRSSMLSDWEFPVAFRGMVILLDRRIEESGGHRTLRLVRSASNRTLAWAGAQGLPLLIAAMGYESNSAPAAAFRARYHLAPDTPLLCGPLPDREPIQAPEAAAGGERSSASIGSLLPAVFARRALRFDEAYAQRIVNAVRESATF